MARSSFASRLAFVYVFAVLLLISEQPTHAYIDPGSGSLIYQTVLTLLLGAGFFFRRMLASIGRLFPRPRCGHRVQSRTEIPGASLI